jgi:hypothetical protein
MLPSRWTESAHPCFGVAEARLRAARRFVSLVQDLIAVESDEPPTFDFDAAFRRSEAEDEFPLLAWSTALSHSFSIFESLLADAAAQASALSQVEVRAPTRGGKIEGWIAELRRHGVEVRIAPETNSALKAMRRIRNDLTHGLRVQRSNVEPWLAGELDTDRDGSIRPTARLVRRALTTIDEAIGAVDVGLMLFEDRLHAHYRPPSRSLDIDAD